MFKGRIKPFALSLTAAALMAASHVQAASFNIMAIGDSLTAGYVNGSNPYTPGWIQKMHDGQLNNADGAVNSFTFVGSQGEDDWKNEGYPGDYISEATEVAKLTGTEGFTGTTGISTAARLASGEINPSAPATDANIIMLMIGTNGFRSNADGGAASVAELSLLIDTLTTYLSPTEKLLVSTLSPVAYQRTRFGSSDPVSPGDPDPENDGIREFNENLLDVFTGTAIGDGDGTWDVAEYSSGTIAEHQEYADQVFLLDLNSAFGLEPAENLFQTAGNDYLHFSDLGNELVANFYTDRYYELGLQQVPSPTSAATIILLMAGTGLTRRRRRQAA